MEKQLLTFIFNNETVEMGHLIDFFIYKRNMNRSDFLKTFNYLHGQKLITVNKKGVVATNHNPSFN